MKKIYSTLLLLSISFLTYSQGPEFTIDFEGADPLNNLPAGVTSIDPDNTRGNAALFVNTNGYMFETAGGAIVQQDVAAVEDRAQFANTIFNDAGNNLLQTDYTGHIIINEIALGTDSYTVRLNLQVFGHTQSGTDSGIFTIVGNNGGTWEADWFTSRNGGFASGFGDTGGVGGSDGFQYGTVTPPYREIVITYNDTDKLYRIYIEGDLRITSEIAQTSGDWTNRKFYIGFAGRNSIGTAGTSGLGGLSHLDPGTGEFTANAIRGQDGRNADLQMRMDNIEVYQRAISDADVLTLFNGGSLSTNNKTLESFNAYPNPVNDRLYFSSKNIYSVDIYNILGSKVSSQIVTDGADMSNLNKGVYLVKIKDKSGLELGTVKTVKK
ncbi:T9SS type A sorting domain-containing protein [Flavivirga aquimarina]|uniref:T9SS type A sorting domain-containing protein n=1 Tax=Flavivirga aquimarina TaxID=2027862 RepID=A0ABT8W6W7_9FLAO|nr:T9SS type A sorting domain-containing protein [Flavivirga aquimarina]MDO5968860.1 T9SS type A sorting domain-containing protein [Flavivirga aquimarina]